MKLKSLFFCLLLMIPVAAVFASANKTEESKDASISKGVISGRILDEDHLPLPGATIILKGTSKGTVSDVNGFYRLVGLDGGTLNVEIHYIGFTSTERTVDVVEGKVRKLDIVLESGVELNEIMVQANLQGQLKALNQQKNSDRIVNVVSSDQVSRFPDENIGDALKRIPGVSIQTDMGEARTGHIRGTSPEYNSVTINGDRMPSAEAENRSNQLDLIPSDMIQTIEVSKVITSDMDGDAIGGAVNLVTKSSPYKRRISGSIVSGYNFGSEKAPLNASLLYGDRFMNNKLGMVLSASFQDNHTRADNIEAEWESDDVVYTSDFQIRQYTVQRQRQSYSAAFDYEWNENHKLKLDGLYNRRKDWENRYRLRYKDLEFQEDGSLMAGSIRRQTKGGTSDNKDTRLEDQENMNFALSGEHHFGALEMKWRTSYAKASEERPNERYISYQSKDQTLQANFSDTKRPIVYATSADAQDLNSSWGLKELTEEFQSTSDIDKNVRLDFKLPLSNGINPSQLKFGGRLKMKEKERENSFYEFEPTDEDKFNSASYANLSNQTKSDFELGSQYALGQFVSTEYLGGLNFQDASDFEGELVAEEMAVNFNATEDVYAGYVRYDQTFGKFKSIFGLRLENTQLSYQGYEYDIDDDALNLTSKEESDYSNFLPSIILSYKFNTDFQLKGAWTNTISRPKYFSLVPYKNVSLEDNEISIGNPELDPTTSMNLDLMAEYYWGSIGSFTIGGFYKDISDFIVDSEKRDYTYDGHVWDKFQQDVNGGNATLYGVEVSFQRQLDFLPGFLRNLAMYTNYTYNHSVIKDFNFDGREDEELSLPGTPENTFNASLAYEGKKFNLRASFNYASDFIDELGAESFYDVYYDKVTYLDVNASYSMNKHFLIFAEANNLLNQPLRYYQGSSDYTLQEEYYGTKVQFGVKMNF